MTFITELETLLRSRKETLPEGSYTASLYKEGLDRMLRKIGEEAGEVLIAAKNDDSQELKGEVADLLFHVIVMLVEKGIPFSDIIDELQRRHSG